MKFWMHSLHFNRPVLPRPGQFSDATLSPELAVTQQPGEWPAAGAETPSFTPPPKEIKYLSFLGFLIIFTITDIHCEADRADMISCHIT